MEETQLMAAVMDRNANEVKRLATLPWIDDADSEGYTALMLAAIHRNAVAYKILIEAWADPKKKNSFGYCAEDYARVADDNHEW